MCVNSSNIKSQVCVSYNVKSDSDKLNCKNILSMFSGGLPNDLSFSAVLEEDVIHVNYYSNEYFLLRDYLEHKEKCNAKFYAKKFCAFILNMEENAFLLGLNQIFCDENGLYFIPSLFDNNSVSEPVREVKCFLNSIAGISDDCFSDIKDICSYAQRDGVTVSDIMDYIDNCSKDVIEEKVAAVETIRQCPECGTVYEDKYVFCMKCGCKLQEIKKETESDSNNLTDKTLFESTSAESEKQAESDEVPENKEISEELSPVNDDKTEAIENFNPEKTVVKKIKHLKVKGFKHGAQKKAEATAGQETEKSVYTEDKNEPLSEQQSDMKPEKNASGKAEQVSPNAAKSKYGETTLLGFTNYGETAVLNGLSNHFDMPNLIRKSTDEKIYISKRIFVIGKSADKADYAVNNSAVSRVHAEISVVGSEYYITDKGSTNHTYVNHSEILPNSPWQIFDGDEIMFANEVFTFHFQ